MVRGAARIAVHFGFSPLLIGASVVAFGTSAPEWLVSFFARLEDRPTMALANLLGSNVCNLGLVLGATAVILPLGVRRIVLRRELPYVLLTGVLFLLLCLDGVLSRIDGVLLLISFVFIYTKLVLHAKNLPPDLLPDEESARLGDSTTLKDVLLTLFGLILLAAGAEIFVLGAEGFALGMGMSEAMVGATIVALGTSLPELVTSVVAALRGHADISAGNILGSNLFNLCFVGGSVSLIHPFPVEPEILTFHLPWVLGITIAVWPLCLLSGPSPRISRPAGLLLLAFYVSYLFGNLP